MNREVAGDLSQNPAVIQAFAVARSSVAKVREGNTGSWWNASVIRKTEALISALAVAVQTNSTHIDLSEALGGTGGYDTEEERADNEDRDVHAILSVQPLTDVLARAGMVISGLPT